MSISSRIYLLVGTFLPVLLIICWIAIRGIGLVNTGLENVYRERVIPLQGLKIVADEYAVRIVDVAHKTRDGSLTWENAARDVQEARAAIRSHWADYLDASHTAEERALVEQARLHMSGADTATDRLEGILRDRDHAALTAFAAHELYPYIDPVSERISALVQLQLDLAAREYELANERYESTRRQLIGIAAIATLAGVLMAGFLAYTLRGLRKSMGAIGNATQQVATASAQSSSAIGTVADGARQQSQAIAQAVTAVDQSVTVLGHVSRNAEEAMQISKEAASTVADGRQQMNEMVGVVNRIAENSARISKITDVINSIASQTNMLSLNAAIEAARAGEHGKGFAVVAEQVRKLAESSRSSVQDIQDLVQQAVNDTNAAVGAANRVNAEMSKIAEASGNTEAMMQGIATAIEQQVQTIEELQHNMETLRRIGESNNNAAEEITQTVVELSRIADDTNTEVRRFNI